MFRVRVAFLQKLWHEHLGVMWLAAVLKRAGHEAAVFIEKGERDVAASALAWRPDLVAFSSTTGDHLWALDTAARIRSCAKTPTIMGGAHPTFFPEVIQDPNLDFICRGEGEDALVELADALATGKPAEGIPNLWVKKNGQVMRNPVRPPLARLDSLPFPDRSVYFKYPTLRDHPVKHFIAGRGCPFDCSFCYNQAIKELYRGMGRFVRLPSPAYTLEEVADVKARYGLRTVVFADDSFTYDVRWLQEFLAGYRERIGLPFICNLRPDLATEEVIRALKAANCFRVCIGVETGNERIRVEVLNKRITNAQILETVRLLRKYRLPFLANTMVGIPGETLDDALETVRFNARIRTDYPWCSILQPYPKTKIAEFAAQIGVLHGLEVEKFSDTFFKSTPLDLAHRNEIVNLHRLFFIGVKLPVTIPLLRVAVKWPLRRLYDLIFLVTFGYRYMRANRMRLGEIAAFGLKNLALYRSRSAG